MAMFDPERMPVITTSGVALAFASAAYKVLPDPDSLENWMTAASTCFFHQRNTSIGDKPTGVIPIPSGVRLIHP